MCTHVRTLLRLTTSVGAGEASAAPPEGGEKKTEANFKDESTRVCKFVLCLIASRGETDSLPAHLVTSADEEQKLNPAKCSRR